MITNKNKLTLGEFCAGTGAFSLGFEQTQHVYTVFANDIEPNSKKIYDVNFDTKLTLQDIHTLDIQNIPKMDILTAGFPCQPFSIAGQKEGFNDLRSNVFFTIMKIVEFHEPSCIVLENVKNLNTHDNGNTFKIILEHITRLGYTFKFKILNTLHVTNIPHNRERIYIVCFKNPKHTTKFNFPDNTSDIIELKDFLHHGVDDKYYYKNTLKVFNTINNNVTKHISTNTLYQFRRHYVRENKNSVCPTLTANMGTGGHNVPLLRDTLGIRKLTPRECFKLQGFPDSFIFPSISDSALYKLAGNAVTVSVVSKIATLIVDILNC